MIYSVFLYKNNVNVDVESHKVIECNFLSSKKTLLINEEIHLSQRDTCKYQCDICSQEKEERFAFKERFLIKNNHSICVKCFKKMNSIKKYGVDHPFKSEKVKMKINETKIDRYGDKNYNNYNKIRKTNIKRYGTECSLHNPEIKKKTLKTFKEKYGGHHTKNEKFKNRIKNQSLENYGVEYSFQRDDVIKRIKDTKRLKYGNEHYSNRDKFKETLMKNFLIKKISNLYNVKPLFDLSEYNGVHDLYKWKCLECGEEFFDNIDNGTDPICRNCFPKKYGKEEDEVFEFLSQELAINNIIRNDRSVLEGKEIDFYLPDFNLGIELDGLYWHSNLYTEKKYHRVKTENCLEKGIQLIHIFEDEWVLKNNIVKNRLKYILTNNVDRVYARKTIVREIDSKIKNEFLQKNHLQGPDKSTIKLGLFQESDLISVMTFSKPRVSLGYKNIENDVWELSRFSSTKRVVGGASKMLAYFEKNWRPKKIISFADMRWSMGNLYKQLGFKFEYKTEPNYWYFKSGSLERFHRFKFRKDRLKTFENFSKDKTEKQIMEESNYLRIYDCGNYKFTKTIVR